MRKLILGLLSTSLFLSPISKVNANPAVLAPAAFCAGTAGAGCVLIGVATVGGIAYYVWQRRDGKRAYVRKMLVDPEDPEGSLSVPDNGGFYASGLNEANKRCRQKGFKKAIAKKDISGGQYYICK